MESANKPAGRQIVCSGCLRVFPESLINVIPYYNDDAGEFVTTYRCEQCWLPSLDETRARLSSTEEENEIISAATFFDRHGVILHEFRRGDPVAVVRKRLDQMLNLLQSRAIRLAVGPVRSHDTAASNVPVNPATASDEDMEHVSVEVEKYERLGEGAYAAMYEAQPVMAKDCFDDARGYFFKAIEAAKRASFDEDVARLTRRLDHIVRVYNQQFRGVGR
jgi:hypothetical protein